MPLSAEDKQVLENEADKRLVLLYKAVSPLEGSEGYDKWEKQIKRHSIISRWPNHICDLTAPKVTEQQLTTWKNAGSKEGYRNHLCVRNAYAIITSTCDDHAVTNILDTTVEVNHAQEAFRAVNTFFYPKSQPGLQRAYKNFFESSMASTNTTIVEWGAKVAKMAKVIKNAGGNADDAMMKSVLFHGLLPAFAHSKKMTERMNLNFNESVNDLIQQANGDGQMELRKNAQGQPRDNVFYHEDSNQNGKKDDRSSRACYSQLKGTCRKGNKCAFSHDPEILERHRQKEQKKRQQAQQPPPQPQQLPQPQQPQPQQLPQQPQPQRQQPRQQQSPPNPHCMMCDVDTHDTSDCAVVKAAGVEYAYIAGVPEPLQQDDKVPTPNVVWGLWGLLLAVLAAPKVLWEKLPDWRGVLPDPVQQRNLLFMLVLAFMCHQVMGSIQNDPNPSVVNATYFAKASSGGETSSSWVDDTGTTRFVTNIKTDFLEGTIIYNDVAVRVGSGTTTSPCSGSVLLYCESTNAILLASDVLYMPKCGKKLVPCSPFVSKGWTHSNYDYNKAALVNPEGKTILVGTEKDKLYHYDVTAIQRDDALTMAASKVAEQPGAKEWSMFGLPMSGHVNERDADFGVKLLEAHHCFGHVSFTTLRRMFGLKQGTNPECAVCSACKSRQQKLHTHHVPRSTRVNHRKHMDLGFTADSQVCFQVYVDDYTREGDIDFLRTKGEAFSKWLEYKARQDNDHAPWKTAFIRTDNDTVYTTDAWLSHRKEHGIEHEFSARYRQAQNGVAESCVRTIGVTFRCMMLQGNAPASDQKDALLHAKVVRNYTPTAANGGWSPKEKAAGMRLGLNKRLMRAPIFCLCYAHVYKEEPRWVKHAMNGIPCVYLGFDARNNQYKVKEWVSGRVYYTADLTFHGKIFPYRANPTLSQQWMHEMDAVSPRVPVSAANPAPSMPPVGPRRSERVHEYQFSGGQDVRSLPDAPAPPESLFVHSFGPDPAAWSEAMDSPYASDWVEADLMEKNSLFHEHATLEIVPRAEARGKRVFRNKSVFKIKINPPGVNATVPTIEKFKVRVTIAALKKLMRPGIDYAEKRASTVRWEAVLALLAIAAAKDLEITLFDIKTFFLYGQLRDEIYMEQVSRWVDEKFPASDFIYRLRGNLYGLPQASHIAQGSLRECLTANDTFRSTTADDCVYVRSQGKSEYVATGTHVDDLPAVGTVSGLSTLEKTLKSKFTITVKPNPDVIMGVQVERDRPNRSIKLHQQMYVVGILHEYDMVHCKPMDTPIDPGMAKAMMLLPTETSEPQVRQQYQKLVGMLIWLHKTRVDLLFTINFLSRFLACATQQHFDYARGRPLRYLKGASKLGIVLKPGANVTLSAESDADWAGDLQSGRSTLGH